MNDELKEILKEIESYENEEYCLVILSQKQNKALLDYITNLQQENERLKQPKIFIDTQDMEERYGEELYKNYLEKQVKDYKSRIEKAIDKVQDIIDIGFDYDGYNDVDNLKILVDELVDLARQTKNILNGRSDE